MPFLLPWVADDLPDDVLRRLVGSAGTAYLVVLRISGRASCGGSDERSATCDLAGPAASQVLRETN
jgi:hypothetical protein